MKKFVLKWWVITRVLLCGVGVIAQIYFFPMYGQFRAKMNFHQNKLISMWGVYDSAWYLDIAKNGYKGQNQLPFGSKREEWVAKLAFFPLYPAMMAMVAMIVRDYFVAGLIVSNAALIIGAVFLYKLVRLSWSEEVAKWSVRFLFVYPTSFILSGVFSEGLFLMLVVGCWYLVKKQKWRWAGVVGCLVVLARPVGIMIWPGMIYEWFRKKDYKNGEALLMMPGVYLCFMVYIWNQIGGIKKYAEAMSRWWGFGLENPLNVLQKFVQLGTPDVLLILGWVGLLLGAIGACVVWLGWEYWLIGMGLIGPSLVMGWGRMVSVPRYSCIIFPLYILLGLAASKREDLKVGLFLGNWMMQLAVATLWVNGMLII